MKRLGTSNDKTSLGGEKEHFPETSSSILHPLARRGSQADRTLLQHLLTVYWKPIYSVIRYSWRKNNEEAKDLTQDFLCAAFVEGTLLQTYSPEKGNFRSYLKGALRNFMRNADDGSKALKRGGHTQHVRMNSERFEFSNVIPDPRGMTPEQMFDAAWRHEVLADAVLRTRRSLSAGGREIYFRIFEIYDLNPRNVSSSYAEVAQTLGLRVDDVRHYLSRARAVFRQSVHDVISEYASGPRAVALELADLFQM